MNKNSKLLTASITVVATTVLLLVWQLTSSSTTITNALTITSTINVPISAIG
jgi:hypothetical protein